MGTPGKMIALTIATFLFAIFLCASSVAAEFHVESNGWSWVYQGVGHRQSFVAIGSKIEELRVRVARLNERFPSDRLVVEIRDPDLELIYARGAVSPMRARREFAWVDVRLSYLTELKKGKTYVLLFHSVGTQNNEPWLINTVYEDTYPAGRHNESKQDLFFSLTFANDEQLIVGPHGDGASVLPINSGAGGGAAFKLPGGSDQQVFPQAERAAKSD